MARSYECGNVEATLFPVAEDGSDLGAVVEDALGALRSRGMAWLEATHDVERFLRRVGNSPADYMPKTPSIPYTDDERREIDRWLAERGIAEGELVMWSPAFGDMPEPVRRRFETTQLRDHTAMDGVPPYGDLLYGLLVGSGRLDEAIETMRRDGDPAWTENHHAELLAAGISKRAANAMRRRSEAHQAEIRARLAMLEADQDRRTGA